MGRLATSLVLSFACLTANAATFRGDEAICNSLAATAYDVVGLRDAGVGWDVFHPWISGALKDALMNPASYVKDQDDVEFVLKWFGHIYATPALSGLAAVQVVQQECMKKPLSLKRKVVV